MKHINILILAAAVLAAGCKKSFLEESPSNAVDAATAIKTPNDLTDAVNGLYTAAKSSSFFGQNVPVLGDLLADNVFISSSNYGQFITQSNYSFIATSGEPSGIWSQGYYTILQANRIISAPVPASAAVNQLKGEAYTWRALSYLTLVNYFAAPYTLNPEADGVPITTTPTYVTGPYVKLGRNPVSEVYKQIISDLDSAYQLMPATAIAATYHATSSNYISKWAAKAIAARAYLYKGDYASAKDAALAVVQSGGYSLATTAAAFSSYWTSAVANTGKLETILELYNGVSGSVTGLADLYYQAGNGEMLATAELYNLYSATDYRKGLILKGIRKGNSQPGLIVNKYSNFLNSDKDEIRIIRYAEVILTLAESYARTGDANNARLYLNQLAKLRDPQFAGYTSSGQQLLDDILNERRKELAFEGLRFFDLTRLNLVINRPAQPFSYPLYPQVSLTDFRRLQPIPQGEIDANPKIKQNPGYN
ncbi:MAG: RagB/SusD family nutrient uptake outer membrane protein [Williamsia sp.]|nr:RagB/SusD family nutrient uptake outer membrane protein [Williamsia sp.]